MFSEVAAIRSNGTIFCCRPASTSFCRSGLRHLATEERGRTSSRQASVECVILATPTIFPMRNARQGRAAPCSAQRAVPRECSALSASASELKSSLSAAWPICQDSP